MGKRVLVLIGFLLTYFSGVAAPVQANEKALIASMVRDYRAVGDASQKERLRLLKGIVGNYGKLLSDYDTTEIGLEVLISGEYMGVNFSNITVEYLQELSDYYGKVCKDTPSYACLGFTTLNEGYKSCRDSKVNEAVRGARLLRKSSEIFSSSSSSEYSDVSLSALKDCVARQSNPETKGTVNYQLVAEVINQGRLSADWEPSTAAIQKMDRDSIYRFLAVIDLQNAQGKLSSAKDKLIKTLSNRFADQPERFRFASVHLWSRLFESGYQVSPFDLVASDKYSCSREYSEEDAINQDYMMGYFLRQVQLARNGKSLQFRSDPADVKRVGDSVLKMTCGGSTHIWEAKLYHMVKGHAERLELIDQVASNYNEEQLIAYEVDTFLDNSNQLEQFLKDRELEAHPLVSLWYSRKYLDEGDVCSSVKKVFQLPREQLWSAMDYILKSPKFDSSANYECGDEDLTLLLGSV